METLSLVNHLKSIILLLSQDVIHFCPFNQLDISKKGLDEDVVTEKPLRHIYCLRVFLDLFASGTYELNQCPHILYVKLCQIFMTYGLIPCTMPTREMQKAVYMSILILVRYIDDIHLTGSYEINIFAPNEYIHQTLWHMILRKISTPLG